MLSSFIFNRKQERITKIHLRFRCTRIEECRRGVREELPRHQVISFQGGFQIATVNTTGGTHQQMLRSFHTLAMHTEKVRLLKGFETKKIIAIVASNMNKLRMLPTNVKRHIGGKHPWVKTQKKRVKAGNSTNPAGKICQETLVVNGFVQLLCIGFYKFIDLFWQQCLGFRLCAFRFDTKNKTARRGESQTLQRCFYGQGFSGKTRATSPKVQLVGPVDPCSCTKIEKCCKSRKRTLRYSYASSRRQCLENMDPMDPQEWRGFRVGKQKFDNQKLVL